jgi:hypothetical protein
MNISEVGAGWAELAIDTRCEGFDSEKKIKGAPNE